VSHLHFESKLSVPNPNQRLGYIDGLRAMAALWVAVHHAAETSVPEQVLKVPILGPMIASFFWGQFPVMVFLMLSGFCLYFPLVRKNPLAPTFSGWGGYLRRRWTRIAPPYLIAGAFCMILAAFPTLNLGKWKDVSTLDPTVIASHVLMVHNLIPAHAAKIDYPMWSIGLEWQLYLLFPIVVWSFRRHSFVVTLGVTLAIATIIRASYRYLPPLMGAALRDGPFSYLMIFAVGMLAAHLSLHQRILLPKVLLGLIAVAGLAMVRLSSGNGLFHDLATASAFFAVLQLASDPSSRVARILSAPWLVAIGIFSYSIYLVHAPLLHLSWFALRQLELSNDLNFIVLTTLVLPAIVVLSYIFHLWFERPFMRMPRKAKKA
jgi:peptidoglycan/LPS O-acetylase OafA/YrhL